MRSTVRGGSGPITRQGNFAELGEHRKWVEGACADPARLFHAIVDTATGKAAGVAAYINVQPAIGSVEIGSLVFSPLLQPAPGRDRGDVSDDAPRLRRAGLSPL